MIAGPLAGRRIAVFLEHKFIPEEIDAYRVGFSLLGAEVELISRVWFGDWRPDEHTFYSDVDPLDDEPWQSPRRVKVARDLSSVKPGDYSAIIMSANYTSVRLRWEELPPTGPVDARAHVQAAPVPRFFAEAMKDKRIVKGALCHGLWVLTPFPELLRGRRVTCHTVVMADVLNAGATVVFDTDRAGRNRVAPVVTDDDLVTGFSKHEVEPFIQAIAERVRAPIS